MIRPLLVLILLTGVNLHMLFAQKDGPKLLEPSNGANNVSLTPVLVWESEPGETYVFKLSRDNQLNTVLLSLPITTDGGRTQLTIDGMELNRTYFWCVKVQGADNKWSDTNSFTTTAENMPDGNMSALSPPDCAISQVTKLALEWSPVENAVSYDIQLSPIKEFITVILSKSGITETRLTTPVLSPGIKYYWRVRPNFSSSPGKWSAAFSFSTGAAPLSPKLSLPLSEAKVAAGETTFSWEQVETASAYHLQISRTSTFNDLVVDEPALTTKNAIVSLPPNELLFWRVSALNNFGEGTWSPWQSVYTTSSTDVAEEARSLITNFSATPNPAGNLLKVSFTIPAAGQVAVSIFDLTGLELMQQVEPFYAVGTYEVPVNTTLIPNGVYMYRVIYNNIAYVGRRISSR